MILTLENSFKQTLPPAILRAQYRAPKILIEHKVPTRLLGTLHYLISITNLSRSGRIHYARPKMAALLNTSERTVDRNIALLENAGLLYRRVRSQEVNGWFFGSSLQWAEHAWHALFVAKPRSHDKLIAHAKIPDSFAPAEQAFSTTRTTVPSLETRTKNTESFTFVNTEPHTLVHTEGTDTHPKDSGQTLPTPLGTGRLFDPATHHALAATQPPKSPDEKFIGMNFSEPAGASQPEPGEKFIRMNFPEPTGASQLGPDEKFIRMNFSEPAEPGQSAPDQKFIRMNFPEPIDPGQPATDQKFIRMNFSEQCDPGQRTGNATVESSLETNLSNNTAVSSEVTYLHKTDIHKPEQAKISISSRVRPRPTQSANSRIDVRLPRDLQDLARPFDWSAKTLWMLLGIAKRTDANKTGRRLQDALTCLGPRMMALGLAGDAAGRYLYKCLASGTDFAWLLQEKAESAQKSSYEDWVREAHSALRLWLETNVSAVINGCRLSIAGGAVYVEQNGIMRVATSELASKLAVRVGCFEPWAAV